MMAFCPCAPILSCDLVCAQVSPGTYLLEVLDTQSVWPTVRALLAPRFSSVRAPSNNASARATLATQVRLDVSATSPGKARALLTHSRQPLPFPLPLEPLVAKPTFFEKREGFQVCWPRLTALPPAPSARFEPGAHPVDPLSPTLAVVVHADEPDGDHDGSHRADHVRLPQDDGQYGP